MAMFITEKDNSIASTMIVEKVVYEPISPVERAIKVVLEKAFFIVGENVINVKMNAPVMLTKNVARGKDPNDSNRIKEERRKRRLDQIIPPIPNEIYSRILSTLACRALA